MKTRIRTGREFEIVNITYQATIGENLKIQGPDIDGILETLKEVDEQRMVVVDGDNPIRYKCTVSKRCKAQFSTEEGLGRHVATKHPIEKKFNCPDCQQSFFTIQSLNKHIKKRICQKNRAHKCDDCGLVVDSEKRLATHRRKKHQESYSCEHCNQSFLTHKDFRNHRKSCLKQANKKKGESNA